VSRLHVGVNLLYLKPGGVGGSEEYVVRLVRALDDEAASEVELTLFVNRRFRHAHPDLAARHRVVEAPITGDWPPLRIAAEASWLARQASRRPLALVHHVANTIPQIRTRPAIVTIHDLQPLDRPEDLGRVKGTYLRRRLAASARQAAVVVTVSEYVRGLVIDRFELDPARVVVVSAPNRPLPKPPRAVDSDGRCPFFLYPAVTLPHKNHLTLLRAFARVVRAHPDAGLVLTGRADASEGDVRAEVARLGLDDRVRRLGWLARDELDDLFGRATALTFPSRHEGYGLPVAEAMAEGCPVVAADATALPEVVGGAGLLVDPDDVEGWAAAMIRLLEDGDLRTRLVTAGRERVRSHTPQETARRMVAAYCQAASTG
jgi:alpha-1,3-rhamnosyl/mannosyltransferase